MQQVFFYRLGKYDRKNILDKKFAELNEQGWDIKSVTYDGEEYMVLAELVDPPQLFFHTVDASELDEAREILREQLASDLVHYDKPIFLSGETTFKRNGNTLEFSDLKSLKAFIHALQGVDKEDTL